uniref:Uncharacterized protein n=1 Tax=Anguilla anguilla TaxID=7936 RepID=A0A0E9WEJ5_ANGAN
MHTHAHQHKKSVFFEASVHSFPTHDWSRIMIQCSNIFASLKGDPALLVCIFFA